MKRGPVKLGNPDVPTRTQLRVLRLMAQHGWGLMAEPNGECWLYDLDSIRSIPKVQVSEIVAYRLIVNNWISGYKLSAKARAYLEAH